MIDNPWIDLPSQPPFIAAIDMEAVERHNAQTLKDPESTTRELHLNLLPEPYVGNRFADVVLLLNHPGVDPRDYEAHQRPDFQAAVRANLAHEPMPWPLYPLNPAFEGTPASAWWNKLFREVSRRVDQKVIAESVVALALSPYHSEGGVVHAPSRRYTGQLLREAMSRQALVIGLLGKRPWVELVPELEHYRACYWPPSHRRSALLTTNSLGADPIERMVRRLS